MTYQEAQEQIRQGKRVFRESWEKILYVWSDSSDDPVRLRRYDGKVQYFGATIEDQLADDWEVRNG